MSRLTRNGTAKSVSRDQILRRERDREILFFFIFPVHVQLITKNRIGNLINSIIRVIHTLLYTIHINRRYFQHAHFIPIVGVGKRGEY